MPGGQRQDPGAIAGTRRVVPSALPQFGLALTETRVVYASRGPSGTELRAIRYDGSDSIVLSRSLAARFASHPFLIVRRRFGQGKLTIAAVEGDPQPDLPPSSAGALYFRLRHGWMRWDFGTRRPRPTKLDAGQWIVGYENGRLLLRTGSQCLPRLIVRIQGRSSETVPVPVSTTASTRGFGPLCRLMTDFAWTGRRLVVAWAVIPRISLNVHTNVGLVGVVIETTVA